MGGGKGGPSGSTTSTQTSEPWGPQQPYLQDIFTRAQGLYQGTQPQYYPGTTLASPTAGQTAALQGMQDTAAQDPLRSIPASTVANIAGGSTLGTNPALAPLQSLAGTNWGDYGNQYEMPFANSNAANSAPGNSDLASYISGARLTAGNPYTGAVSDSVLSEVLPRIQSQFAGGGMLSSPEAARASSAGATSALAPFAFSQYQQDEQHQIDAANAEANRYMQGAGLQQSAASDLAGRFLSGTGQQQQAASSLGSTYEGGIGDMLRAAISSPVVQATQYSPLETMFNAGSAGQGFNQQAITDAIQRWNYGQELPYNSLNEYIGQVTGNYGGTTTLTQPYFNNSGQNALGGAVGGASLGSSLLAPALGLSGAAGGGIGAGLGALLMLSDRRLKSDVEHVGELHNGLKIYSYRYVDDPAEMRRVGLMADEVEDVHPEAVATVPFGALAGYKAVDYARATAEA